MEELTSKQILDAALDDWRKFAQALHARFTPVTLPRAFGSSPPCPRSPREPIIIQT